MDCGHMGLSCTNALLRTRHAPLAPENVPSGWAALDQPQS